MLKLRSALFTLLIAALIMVSGFACGRSPGIADQSGTGVPTRTVALSSSSAVSSQLINATALSDAAEKSIDSVVNISTTQMVRVNPYPFFDNPFFRDFFGRSFGDNQPREVPRQGLGSGVIVDSSGIILTNNHVIENANKLTVILHDKRKFDAEVVGTDPASDIAVLRLTGKVDNLKPLPFGNSDALRLGEIVLAIGNPFGLSHTVTMGIISAKGRADVGIAAYEDFIQTDAAINPGNSGGALINLRGELVGINTAIASQSGGSIGIGFAIPSNMAKTIMEGLEKHGKIDRGWIGVTIQDLTPELAEALNVEAGRGVLIEDVLKDSPGKKAGLKPGDIILSINGEAMESAAQLRNKVATIGPGKKVTLRVLRDKKEMNVELKLEQRPTDTNKLIEENTKGDSVDGISVVPINSLTRQQYRIPDDVISGVLVTGVERNSPAASAGIQPGDIILEVNRVSIDSVDTFLREYKKAKGKVLLYINRNGNRFFRVVNK